MSDALKDRVAAWAAVLADLDAVVTRYAAQMSTPPPLI